MNCHSCQEESDAYREDKLSSATRIQVEDHLRDCRECSVNFKLLALADKVISEEKEILSNPFIQTRIMAGIEHSETTLPDIEPLDTRSLRPAIIALSLAAAILAGVFVGNISRPEVRVNKTPYELTLINDASIESVELFLND